VKPVVAITVGDYNGIGPEVTLKALCATALRRQCRPVVVGPPEVFRHYARSIGITLELPAFGGIDRREAPPLHGRTLRIECVPVPGRTAVTAGKVSAGAGRTAIEAIRRTVELLRTGQAEAMVTAPLSKYATHRAGSASPGQTELLLRLSGSRRVAMMMVSRALTVGLVTLHEPLRRVPALVTSRRISEAITIVHNSLRRDFQVPSPRLAVLGLNPHAGEDGDIGTEEKVVIVRTIRSLRRSGLQLEGPFPADGFFAHYSPGRYDAIIAMYHDQGLVPFKILARNRGVNFSAGLNIIRTSPAHGTAFDIAGRGTADPGSMAEAIRLAAQLARRRRADTEGKLP
jgi:4-hydroxythreonine-4-phosphate dehydrogenase